MVGCGTAARPSPALSPQPGNNNLTRSDDREVVCLSSEAPLGRLAPASELKDAGFDWVETVLMAGIPTNANADDATSTTSAKRTLSHRRWLCSFLAAPIIRSSRRAIGKRGFIEGIFFNETSLELQDTYVLNSKHRTTVSSDKPKEA